MKKYLFVFTVLTLIATNAFAISPGINGRSKGDVIAVRTDDQIAAWCDFSKQIINTQLNTLCVYNGSNQSMASGSRKEQAEQS